MNRRDLLLGLLAAGLAPLPSAALARRLYELPDAPGCATLLHLTDCHAQLLPLHYREPSENLGAGAASGQPPHLVGAALLRHYGLDAGGRAAHAFTHLDFAAAARTYGPMGGFAHLATLVQQLRAQRPGAVLVDGGDSWQGSATALWTRGADMRAACQALGVEVMTGHWEFTYGADEVLAQATALAPRLRFLAQNVRTADFGDPVFEPSVLREINGHLVGIIGQAYPYTPVANPRRFVAGWRFGIGEDELRAEAARLRRAGARAVVLLSHCGLDTDLKLASRVGGIDAILGGHTHDALPRALPVAGPTGTTLVANAGSHGKFLGVLDLEVSATGTVRPRYQLLPVFADLLDPDPAMAALVRALRAPHLARLQRPLARTEGLLYRRSNFGGTFDALILRALMQTQDARIGFSPGFRWGGTLLPGDTVTVEDLMGQMAVTYPQMRVTEYTGAQLHAMLEDVCDNLFNPDPYRQQGGDLVRVGGLRFACRPRAPFGRRIDELRLDGEPLDPARRYRTVSWAGVGDEDTAGPPAWEAVEQWLRARGTVPPLAPPHPRLEGVAGDPGLA